MLPSYIQRVHLSWENRNLIFSGRDHNPDAKHIVTALEGWFGGVGVKGEALDLLGHGSYHADKKRDSRAITLEATMLYASDFERRQAARAVSGVLGNGTPGTLTSDADGFSLATEVYLDGDIKVELVGKRAIRVQIPMVAPDPRLYAEERRSIMHPAGFGEGLEFNLFSKSGILSYGNSVPTSKVAITNGGNFKAYPRFEIQGDFPSGFRLTSDSKAVEFPVPCYPQSPVIVDMTGSVTVNGNDMSHLLNRRDWFGIEPGETIQPRITSLQEGHGWSDVFVADTYI